MALSSSDLSTRLQTAISGISGISITSSAELASFCTAIAGAIVAEIQAAVVTVPGAGLVAPGGGGAVTGSATGSLS